MQEVMVISANLMQIMALFFANLMHVMVTFAIANQVVAMFVNLTQFVVIFCKSHASRGNI
jgi:hypothetical protein